MLIRAPHRALSPAGVRGSAGARVAVHARGPGPAVRAWLVVCAQMATPAHPPPDSTLPVASLRPLRMHACLCAHAARRGRGWRLEIWHHAWQTGGGDTLHRWTTGVMHRAGGADTSA